MTLLSTAKEANFGGSVYSGFVEYTRRSCP